MKYIFIFIFSIGVYITNAQTPEQLKSWLPVVENWTISEEVEVFDPENLFDRINGAAPLFLENNFREMTSVEYQKDKDYITLQIYRHATPEDAFGMYASERSSELDHYLIGGEAQGDNVSLFFFAGDIYVKMWGNSSENIQSLMHRIGEELAKKIKPDASYPAKFRIFPQEDKLPYSEEYITANYIGHEFLKNVYVAKYNKEGKPFQLFLVDGKTIDGAKDILTKYYTFARQPLDFAEGTLVIKDRYNGDIPVFWKGQYIIGVFSENGNAMNAVDLIKLVSDKL